MAIQQVVHQPSKHDPCTGAAIQWLLHHVQVVGRASQKLPAVNPQTYLGPGKLAELTQLAKAAGAETVIFVRACLCWLVADTQQTMRVQPVLPVYLLLPSLSCSRALPSWCNCCAKPHAWEVICMTAAEHWVYSMCDRHAAPHHRSPATARSSAC